MNRTASRLFVMVRERGYRGGSDHFRAIVARFRPRQLFYDGPQAGDFHRRQVRYDFRENPRVLFLFGNIAMQKPEACQTPAMTMV